MTLRSDATQAIAQAILKRHLSGGLANVASSEVRLDALEDANAALDALLDYLEAHAEEWARLTHLDAGHSHVVKLIAVLRVEP